MTGFRFDPNPRFADEARADAEFKSNARQAADAVAAGANRAGASRGPFKDTRYEAADGPKGARVTASGGWWHLLEWGTASHAPWAPFRTGCEAAGLEYRDDG